MVKNAFHILYVTLAVNGKKHIRGLFGDDIKIKSDLFHVAVQGLTSTLDKRHRLYNTFCDELRGVFRY